jgi:prolyl oligopeptidase
MPMQSPTHPIVRTALALAALTLAACQGLRPASSTPAPAPATFAMTDATDPYLWMEDADSPRAIEWARKENARTFAALESGPLYAKLYQDALTVSTTRDRIPAIRFAGGDTVRDFWQDATAVRGVWRETSIESYRSGSPAWQTVFDLDAVAKAENANWVWKGAQCLPPAMQRCLVKLSDGGKDADTLREYDVHARRFVDGGFAASESKQDVEWWDADTLYIARDWGGGTLTTSGYPFVVKAWKRGTPIESAREVFRGEKSDVAAGPTVLRDPDGHPRAVIVERAVTYFERRYFLLTPNGPVALPFPLRSALRGFVDGQVVIAVKQDVPAQGLREGDLASFDLAALEASPAQARASVVLRPASNEAIDGVASTRGRLLVALYRDVKGTLVSFAHDARGWTRKDVPMPADGSVDLEAADDASERAIVTTRGFLTPTAQWLVDAERGTRVELRKLPAQFDASRDVVEQRWATSNDGTQIPYFVVRPKDLVMNGRAPTLLYAYGGFQVSETPFYSGVFGRLWLERGGVLVIANIRGGGEFGPRWHRAGLKENRQKVFDDFYAVAHAIIDDKLTSPRRLGIMGGSNGGLLMGVAMTQHPELFHAIVIQVPLFDMLRYTKIGAGASWIGEYGDPSIPAERAYIARYSPYQHLMPGVAYPEVLFETSTKDDRVHPAHARKAAARLEAIGVPFY